MPRWQIKLFLYEDAHDMYEEYGPNTVKYMGHVL